MAKWNQIVFSKLYLILWGLISIFFTFFALFSSSNATDPEYVKPPLVSPVMYYHEDSSEEDSQPENILAENDNPLSWDNIGSDRDREHIQEHMEYPSVLDTSEMTEEELQFHYFRIHDADKDNHLDGCELIKSVIHWHGEDNASSGHYHSHNEGIAASISKAASAVDTMDSPQSYNRENKIWKDEDLINIIDPILHRHDLDGDGLISYAEFKCSLHLPGQRKS